MDPIHNTDPARSDRERSPVAEEFGAGEVTSKPIDTSTPVSPSQTPVAAEPTENNTRLLLGLMLGLTLLMFGFAGMLIVMRTDLDPILIVKITVLLALVANVIVLSFFTIGKSSNRRLYKLRKAAIYLMDPDIKELS